jgi:hypothetical protein
MCEQAEQVQKARKFSTRGPSVKDCEGCEALVKEEFEKYSTRKGLYVSYRKVCKIYYNREPRHIPWCPIGLCVELDKRTGR